jgi:hypothetical protein
MKNVLFVLQYNVENFVFLVSVFVRSVLPFTKIRSIFRNLYYLHYTKKEKTIYKLLDTTRLCSSRCDPTENYTAEFRKLIEL